MVGFEETKSKLDGAKSVVVTGTPTKIRKLDIKPQRKKELLDELGIKNDLPIVLIFGGSQGAQRINQAVMDLIKLKKNERPQIIWATGPKQYDVIKDILETDKRNINNVKDITIVPYIYNMEELMNVVDIIVARSGAMTITEISNLFGLQIRLMKV